MICISLAAKNLEVLLQKIEVAQKKTSLVEIRLDSLWPQLGNSLVTKLEDIFAKLEAKCIITLRSVEQGGEFDGDKAICTSILRKTLNLGADYIDLEFNSPSLPDFAGDRDKIICSWHDFKKTPSLDKLETLAAKMNKFGGIIKLAPYVSEFADTLILYRLSQFLRAKEQSFVVFGMGEEGVNTRLLAPILGSKFTFAALSKGEAVAPGQLSFEQTREAWGRENVDVETEICGVFGHPLAHSKSPSFHREAYKKRGTNAIFLPFETDSAKEAAELIKTLSVSQASITAPLKTEIITFLDEVDTRAAEIGAVNTVINDEGILKGYNTDEAGFGSLLEKNRVELKGKRICLLGAGGAAKLVASLLAEADLTDFIILNRNFEKAKLLAEKYGAKADSLKKLKDFDYDILIDATSIALDSKAELEAPWMKEDVIFYPEQTIITLVYEPAETYLLKKAKTAKAKAINGWDMFVGQAEEQLQLKNRKT